MSEGLKVGMWGKEGRGRGQHSCWQGTRLRRRSGAAWVSPRPGARWIWRVGILKHVPFTIAAYLFLLPLYLFLIVPLFPLSLYFFFILSLSGVLSSLYVFALRVF